MMVQQDSLFEFVCYQTMDKTLTDHPTKADFGKMKTERKKKYPRKCRIEGKKNKHSMLSRTKRAAERSADGKTSETELNHSSAQLIKPPATRQQAQIPQSANNQDGELVVGQSTIIANLLSGY
jgi:phage-related protein